MKKIILTVIILLAVFACGFLLYIKSGMYDISQLTPHNSFTKWVINTTKHNSIDKRMKDNNVPANLGDSSLIIEGFTHYNEMCSGCHAAPGKEAEELAQGLYPKPPLIYKHAEESDAQEFFWIIKNGIKMTSMPAYGPTHDDQKIWAITAFVTSKLPKMSADEYKEWSKKYALTTEEEK